MINSSINYDILISVDGGEAFSVRFGELPNQSVQDLSQYIYDCLSKECGTLTFLNQLGENPRPISLPVHQIKSIFSRKLPGESRQVMYSAPSEHVIYSPEPVHTPKAPAETTFSLKMVAGAALIFLGGLFTGYKIKK